MASDRVEAALEFFARHDGERLAELVRLVRIASVSFPGFAPERVRESARAVAALLNAKGDRED